MPRDKFLKEQIKLDEGWVPLETMIKFNRLNRLTTDFNVIVQALSKSKAKLMEVSADKTKIRRSPSRPLPEVTDEYKNDVNHRRVTPVAVGENAELAATDELFQPLMHAPHFVLAVQMPR